MDANKDTPTLTRAAGAKNYHTFIQQIKSIAPKEACSWQLVQTVLMGQGLAALICGTAISSQYLATEFHVNTPMMQSVLNYALLCVTYTTMLLFTPGDGHLLQVLKSRGWKYLLLGLVDVQANYTVVKAYQYTSLTSIQLLDCFVVPMLMVLSWWFLKTRYTVMHCVSVCVCLLGVGAMVGADILSGRDQGSTSNILLGDGLVLISATLYAVSNVCQEYTVKNLSRVEFLGMVGLFGTLISTVQMVILERNEVANIIWSWQVGVLFAGYAGCMYALYSCMPIVVKMTSATSVNLSLLTSDLFSLFCGLFLFQYKFSVLYLVSLVVILIGFVAFNVTPTPSDVITYDAHSSSSSSTEDTGDHDPVLSDRGDIGTDQDVRVQIAPSWQVEGEDGQTERRRDGEEGRMDGRRDEDERKSGRELSEDAEDGMRCVAVGRGTRM